MLMTTTSTLDGIAIKKYLGVVTGETIMGANIIRDLVASIRDIVGGRSTEYEQSLVEAKTIAMAEMEQMAEKMGANAIIGIDLDYETVGQGTMLMVSVSGTAVIIE
jgi:uncharacterized protein YbjQ (UPF0145 family)